MVQGHQRTLSSPIAIQVKAAELQEQCDKERAEYEADPWRIVTEIIYPDYQFKWFHKQWFDVQWNNRTTFIKAPRGHAKTTICDTGYLVCRILLNPNIRILLTSKTATQAQRFAGDIRAHFEQNKKIKALWGNQVGSPWNNDAFVVATRNKILKEPTVTAIGVVGPLVSMHVDIHMNDDVIDFDNTRTEKGREKIIEWVGMAQKPTLEPGGYEHWLGTRYHPDDYYGTHLLKEYSRNNIVTNTDTQRAIVDEESGELLWPERCTLDAQEAKETGKIDLAAIREMVGPIIFSAQYSNDAEAMKGLIIKPDYIKHYKLVGGGAAVLAEDMNEPIPIDKLTRATGTDQAISEKEQADPSAVATIGYDQKSKKAFLLPAVREGHWDVFRQLEEIKKEAIRYIPSSLGIEDVGYQRALYQLVYDDFKKSGLINRTSVKRVARREKGAKVTRVTLTLVPIMAAGNFYILENEHESIEREMLAFTDNSSKAHRLDAIEMGVQLATKSFRGASW